VGSSLGEPPAGCVLDDHQVRLGAGRQVFERARAALRDWAMFRVGWVEVCPPCSPIEEGMTFALLARGLGVWALFGCRIVRVIEGHGPVELYGFASGTLPGHALSGEERFTIQWDRVEDSVWYDVLAISRPSHFVWRLGYPLLRRIQRRFAPASLRAMAHALEGGER
jgi:uncharacterized protein (UPF0548 family)